LGQSTGEKYPYFWRYPNFLTRQSETTARKPPHQKPAPVVSIQYRLVTDGRTDNDSKYRTGIAQHGKNTKQNYGIRKPKKIKCIFLVMDPVIMTRISWCHLPDILKTSYYGTATTVMNIHDLTIRIHQLLTTVSSNKVTVQHTIQDNIQRPVALIISVH